MEKPVKLVKWLSGLPKAAGAMHQALPPSWMGQGQIQGVPNLPRMALTNMENQIRELKVQAATMQDMLLNRAEARKPKNEVKAKLNMTIKAIKHRFSD